MANHQQAAIHPRQLALQGEDDLDVQPPRAIAARRRLLVDSGTFLMAAAGSTILLLHAATHGRHGGPPAIVDGAAAAAQPAAVYPLVAFFVLLVGVWLALLVPVAGQFPRTARVGVAIATALHRHLLGALA